MSGRRRAPWRALAAALGVLLAGGLLFATTLRQRGVECEACLGWGGAVHCGRVSAPTREEAEAGAVRNACGVLATGVTQVLACQRTPPLSHSCSD